eukprot:2562536-Pyramimonas_sp.AAC.2
MLSSTLRLVQTAGICSPPSSDWSPRDAPWRPYGDVIPHRDLRKAKALASARVCGTFRAACVSPLPFVADKLGAGALGEVRASVLRGSTSPRARAALPGELGAGARAGVGLH